LTNEYLYSYRMKRTFAYEPSQALTHLREKDPALAAVMDQVGPFVLELSPSRSLFEALLRSIIYQQLHGKAAATIHGRVLEALKDHGGPTHQALALISDEELRAAGLSRNKLLAIRDLAAKSGEGTIPSLKEAAKMTDEELISRLTQVRGIGPWTVHMLLIFVLGRPDVMPTGDFAIRQAFKKLYRKRRDPSPDLMLKQTRHWKPYRSVACWYLWRSLDTVL